MIITNTKNLLLIFVFSLNVPAFFAQDEKGKVWATIEDVSILPTLNARNQYTSSSSPFQKIVRDFEITAVTLAFPASRNRDLQKVYEIECHCNQMLLSAALENAVKGISKPVEAPTYQLMYEPDDFHTVFNPDWALDLIGATEAWDISKGDTNIVLGITDANYHLDHLELQGKMVNVEANMTGPNAGHGTAVAITAAGNTNNGIGKSAIGFDCRLNLYTMGYNQILQASYDGSRVINMSWASGCSSNDYCQSVIDEVYANGSILVASAGNGGTCGAAEMLVFPASYDHVISVTSVGEFDNHEKLGSNGLMVSHQHNALVDISAPGYLVPITSSNSVYTVANGTSFASPYVTGTIGLMLSVNPCLNAEDVEYILKASSTNIDDLNPTYVGLIGAGRLNAAAAVEMARNFSKLTIDFEQVDFACESQTGSVDVNTIGGTGPYNVAWDTGLEGASMSNLDLGTYSITVTDATGCVGDTVVEVTSLGTPAVNFDYTSNLIIDSPTYALNDLNGDGIIKIKGNITVASGVTYLMETKRIEFGYGEDPFSGIIVSDNATLSITKNSILKGINACKSVWDGIIIADNSVNNEGAISYTANPGKLIMDKVNIYDAKIAVKTKDTNPSIVTEDFKYGTVEASNSVFTDNAIGFQIVSNNDLSSQNSIHKTIFLLEDSTILNPVHIELMDVENLVVLKNSFFGNDEVANEHRGMAIRAVNSSLFVAEDINSDFMHLSTDGNEFYNLSAGIKSINTDGIDRKIQITGNYFTKVNQGIEIDQFASGVISSNEFDVPKGSQGARTYGVQLGSHSSLVVTDNVFSTANNSPVHRYGVILTGSDTNKMDVYRNQFDGNFTAANLFEGDNLKTFIDCNTYSGTNDHHWHIAAGKIGDQSGVDVNGQSLIYKNGFATCSNGNPQIFIAPDATGFVYQSKAVYMPKSVTTGVIEAIIVKNAEDNQCRNFFDTTIPTPTIDEVDFGTGAIVFPNPTSSTTSVKWKEVEIDQIAVYASNGELLKNILVTGNTGSYELDDLSAGLYFIKLSHGETIFKTEKLVVSN
jgi:hypothetical protein